jgi:formamidopyrimidine-DNA glycosylase
MPELPEVQTTVDGINKVAKGKKIADVWTDLAVKTPSLPHHHHTTKSRGFFLAFKKLVIGTTIKKAERRAKNILIHLSNGQSIWIHMKMTGHMMYGSYVFDTKSKSWKPDPKEKNEALRDPFNKFLHTVFTLSNGKQLVLSDVRKFAKVSIINTADIPEILAELGPEPLEKSFSAKHFSERLMKRPNRPIKEVLLDQRIVSGIGNIYSDEMLWLAGIHPLRQVFAITTTEMKKLYASMKTVLLKGIDFGGDSTSDYRDIHGNKGAFQANHNAYRMTGKRCKKKGCSGTIIRIAFGGRGAHFCPIHQK